MATFLEFTNLGTPSEWNPGSFLDFGNVGAPYMATFSLPGLTVGLLVWLFSTLVVPSVLSTVQPSPPPEQYHVASKVELSPSSPISSSSSSTLPRESLDFSNQVAKKTKKKKSYKQEANTAAIAFKKPSLAEPSKLTRKVKFPCMLCKGIHLLRDCLGIPKVIDAWSDGHLPLLLASGIHIGNTYSTSSGKTHKKQGTITNPCKLCEGHNPIHLCLYMD